MPNGVLKYIIFMPQDNCKHIQISHHITSYSIKIFNNFSRQTHISIKLLTEWNSYNFLA